MTVGETIVERMTLLSATKSWLANQIDCTPGKINSLCNDREINKTIFLKALAALDFTPKEIGKLERQYNRAHKKRSVTQATWRRIESMYRSGSAIDTILRSLKSERPEDLLPGARTLAIHLKDKGLIRDRKVAARNSLSRGSGLPKVKDVLKSYE